MTETKEILRRYVDREITAEAAADALGPGTAVVDVILSARALFARLPDQRDTFTESEHRRAARMLGLETVSTGPDDARNTISTFGI